MPKPVTPVKFAIADPDAIQETLCDGPFNVSATAGRATITFTHVRPKIEPLFTAGEVQLEANRPRTHFFFVAEPPLTQETVE